MESYKRGGHTVWECKYHLVWVTKYRYPVLGGDVGKRCWVPTNKYWDVLPELVEKTKLALDKAKIEIPFNKMDVNLFEIKNN